MMTIRDAQMEALVAARRRDFESMLTTHLLGEFQGELLSTLGACDEKTVRAFVSEEVETALRYGIENEDDVASLVEIHAEVGAGFETTPAFDWAGKLLRDEQLTSNAKIELLIDGLFGSEI